MFDENTRVKPAYDASYFRRHPEALANAASLEGSATNASARGHRSRRGQEAAPQDDGEDVRPLAITKCVRRDAGKAIC
jgi:hypothetical protein